MSAAADFFHQIASALEQMEEHPHGPEVEDEERGYAGRCLTQICGGDVDQSRAVWREIAVRSPAA